MRIISGKVASDQIHVFLFLHAHQDIILSCNHKNFVMNPWLSGEPHDGYRIGLKPGEFRFHVMATASRGLKTRLVQYFARNSCQKISTGFNSGE